MAAAAAVTGAETSTQTIEARHGTFAALQTPNFRIYLAGQFIASTGTWMQTIAQDWLVLQLTHSPSAVGIAMALQFLPMLLFGMYGGVIADRYPKRRLLMTTQTVNGLLTSLLAVLTISGEIRVGQVYLLALAGGLVFVVDNPTRQVFVNEVVPAADVRNAIALNSAAFQSARLIGPAVSGSADRRRRLRMGVRRERGLLPRPAHRAGRHPRRPAAPGARSRAGPGSAASHVAVRRRPSRTWRGRSRWSASSARSDSTFPSCSPRWPRRPSTAARRCTARSTSRWPSARSPGR